MKKILIVQGGGRPRGNTAQLAEQFKSGVEEAGHQVELISLIKHPVNGCLGCNACRYGKPCIQKDAFNQLVPKIMEADCIVFCVAPVFLDYFLQNKGIYRTFLLHRPGGSQSAPGKV